MGAHSTMVITAADARMELLRKVMEADDASLASMMDAAFYDRLYNFRIVPVYRKDEDGLSYNDGQGLK